MLTTMASITRCCKKADSALRRACATIGAAMLAMLFACAPSALAADQGIAVTEARLELAEDGWQLSADFDIQFTPTLQEAIVRGVPLYFLYEFEVRSPRWYWFDKKNVTATRERRVSYTPLTQQFRISVGNYSSNVSSFDDVKRQLSTLRGWAVTGKDSLKAGEKYEVMVRLKLDTAQLPKPFQLSAFASREWNLASDWHRWMVTPEARP